MDKYHMRENAPELLYEKYRKSRSGKPFIDWVKIEVSQPGFYDWLFPNHDNTAVDDELLEELDMMFGEQLHAFISNLPE